MKGWNNVPCPKYSPTPAVLMVEANINISEFNSSGGAKPGELRCNIKSQFIFYSLGNSCSSRTLRNWGDEKLSFSNRCNSDFAVGCAFQRWTCVLLHPVINNKTELSISQLHWRRMRTGMSLPWVAAVSLLKFRYQKEGAACCRSRNDQHPIERGVSEVLFTPM